MADGTPATQNGSASDLSLNTTRGREVQVAAPPTRQGKGLAFWMAFIAVLVTLFLNVLDLCAIPTALPTIVEDLKGGDKFVWIGSGYTLASTAVLLMCGRLADVFGRRPVMLSAIALFALGSALGGAAQNMDMLIGARVIQGMGGGAIYAMSQIITSDLVPLAERPTYQSGLILVYVVAAGAGSAIGGALSERSSWRWLFYINLPLTGLSFALVVFFLHVNTPRGSIMAKLACMDWLGNGLIAAGSTLTLIGLTWGGVHYPWNSAHVLATLIVGLVLVGAFFVYELFFYRNETSSAESAQSSSERLAFPATLPLDILSNRTTAFGYLATFCHGITSIAAIYYMPIFFQACKDASPLRSSVQTLPIAVAMAPFSMFCGIAIKVSQKYRPENFLGWAISMVGFGVLTLLRPDSGTGKWVGFQILTAAGTGLVYAATVFPVLAPLPVARNASALAFFAFCRTFAQTWGIAIGGAILQNQLKSKLPDEFLSLFPEGVEIAVQVVPLVGGLDEPLRSAVQLAFAESLATMWKVMIGISGAGLLTVFLLKEVPMSDYTDEKYALETSTKSLTDTEKGNGKNA